MTGPVSGSFIHCVLFRGFSSMSSKAAHKHKGNPLTKKRNEVKIVAGKPSARENQKKCALEKTAQMREENQRSAALCSSLKAEKKLPP